VHPGLADQDVRRQVIVVVEQDVGLDPALGAPELGPGKQAQAQTDGGRVQREQLVLEAELVLARPEASLRPKPLRHRPEQVFEQVRGTVDVGVREIGLARAGTNAQMYEFAQAALKAIADLAQRIGAGQLAEQHGGEVRPGREALGAVLGLVLVDQPGEFVARDLFEQLTEETGGPYHDIALRSGVDEPSVDT
jgi:hypothetical protein